MVLILRRYRRRCLTSRSRKSPARVPAITLPSYLFDVVPRTQRRRSSTGKHELPHSASVLSHAAHSATVQVSGLLLRLAGDHLAPHLPRPGARRHPAPKRLEHVRPAAGRLVQVSGAVSAQHESDQGRHHHVQRRSQSAARVVARLSRIFVRIPLQLLRRDSAQLHSDAQPHLVRVSAKHASARSVHAESEGRHAG